MSQFIIDNVDNVDVSVGEFRNLTHVLNRALKKLLDNDRKLYEKYMEATGGIVIQPYDRRKSVNGLYREEDLVWWFDDVECALYVLRCLQDGNKTVVTHDCNINGMFDDCGWHNEFEQLDILDLGFEDPIDSMILQEMSDHQKNIYHHRFGRVSLDEEDPNFLGNKLLNRNIKNLSYNRNHYHFPVQTVQMVPDGTIIKGFYRRYDSGLIEYDINFRLGYTDEKDPERFGSRTILRCNDRKLNDFTDILDSATRGAYAENSRYFSGKANRIFLQEQTDDSVEPYYSVIGTTVQKNRNDYVNTYFAKITFPVQFTDTKYSIYMSDMLSQTSDIKSSQNGSNAMTFCDRTQKSVTAVYVTYPQSDKSDFGIPGYNASNGGLISNSFGIHVIGRCSKHGVV